MEETMSPLAPPPELETAIAMVLEPTLKFEFKVSVVGVVHRLLPLTMVTLVPLTKIVALSSTYKVRVIETLLTAPLTGPFILKVRA